MERVTLDGKPLEPAPQIEIRKFRSHLWPRFWRNPIRWYRFRKLSRRPLSPLEREVAERIERWIVYGLRD